MSEERLNMEAESRLWYVAGSGVKSHEWLDFAKEISFCRDIPLHQAINHLLDQRIKNHNYMKESCIVCDQPAVWFRQSHLWKQYPFCDEHARAHEDFIENGSELDRFFWYHIQE
ncbi:MAG TPA: hypothetical protein PLD54_02575 [Candidatus Levybacteria bacterium]|nr:hypothetical protein [Candidatus Levybacteria bacterium]